MDKNSVRSFVMTAAERCILGDAVGVLRKHGHHDVAGKVGQVFLLADAAATREGRL